MLTFQGYKMYDDQTDDLGITYSYQRRVDTDKGFSYPLCKCNDAVYIDIKYYEYRLNQIDRKSCEISITLENGEGNWCDIKIYSLNPEDLQENIKKYEGKVLAMWEAFNK